MNKAEARITMNAHEFRLDTSIIVSLKKYQMDTKVVVHIRKEGRHSMNRDEGSYTLSHTHDRFLATSHLYRGKN